MVYIQTIKKVHTQIMVYKPWKPIWSSQLNLLQSMFNEHSGQNTFEKIFLKKKDKNRSRSDFPGLYILNLSHRFANALFRHNACIGNNWHKNSWIYGRRQDWHYESVHQRSTSTILSECWRQHVRNISDNFEPPLWSRDFGWYRTLNSTEPSRRFLGLGTRLSSR